MQNPAPESTSGERASLSSAVGKVDFALKKQLSNGELAALRRLDSQNPYCGAFWKVVALAISPAGWIRSSDPYKEEDERNWGILLAGMTQMNNFHQYGNRLGTVLAKAGFSELRFVRLLQARGIQLEKAILRASRFLAAKGKPVDWTDFAKLLMYKEDSAVSSVRRQVARDFYSIMNATGSQA